MAPCAEGEIMWRRYYHVTLDTAIFSIIDNGIDPACSRGQLRSVWLCDSKRLPWAIAHVSSKHGIPAGALWVCVVHCDPRSLKHFRWPGIYLSDFVQPVYEVYEASRILDRGPIRLSAERNGQ